MAKNQTDLKINYSYRDDLTPKVSRPPADAYNSTEEYDEISCLRTAVADPNPMPASSLIARFPPIAIAFRLDIFDWISLFIAILTIVDNKR